MEKETKIMEKGKRHIEWGKFHKLEQKYSKLCLKQGRIENRLKLFKKMPQAIISGIDKKGLYFKRVSGGATPRSGIIYLKSTRIGKNCCDVCGKRRKTTGHHIIPIRTKSSNKELSQLRIRACSECEKKIHPENRYDENWILGRKEKEVRRLQSKLKKNMGEFSIPFLSFLDKRLEAQIRNAKKIPENLKDTPKKIYPAVIKHGGRIRELRYMKKSFRRKFSEFLNIKELKGGENGRKKEKKGTEMSIGRSKEKIS